MRKIFLITLNTLKVNLKKPGNFLIYIIVPIASILLVVFFSNFSNSNGIKVGIINKDSGFLAEDTIGFIKAQPKTKVIIGSEKDIADLALEGKVDCVLTLPTDFTDSILNKSFKNIDLGFVKGEQITTMGEDATSWIKIYLNNYIQGLLDISTVSEGDKSVYHKIYDNYEKNKLMVESKNLKDNSKGKDITVRSMGWIIMFILLGSSFTSSFILNEKKSRTFFRICSSPVTSKEYLAGNLIANLMIVFIQIILSLVMIKYVMRIDMCISILQLFLILGCFSVTAIGISMLVVSISKDSMQVNTYYNIIVTPTCMISGCFWSMSSMPTVLQKIADFLPQRWALEAIEKIQQGKNLTDILVNLVVILLLGFVLFIFSAYRIGKNNSVKSVI